MVSDMQLSSGGTTPRTPRGMSDGKAMVSDMQSWRCPAVLRVKSAVFAAAAVAVALTFFPLWLAIPMAVVLAAWGLGVAVFAATVALDLDAGVLVLRMGLITRRVRLIDITAVLVDKTKVSIARSAGGEISLYAWRKSPLDGWLRVPAVAGDIGHAIASAVALAQDAQASDQGQPQPPPRARTRAGTAARSRSALATTLLGCVGLAALTLAFLVRLSWHNPVMTALGVMLALALGISGLFYVLFTLWLTLQRRSVRTSGLRRHHLPQDVERLIKPGGIPSRGTRRNGRARVRCKIADHLPPYSTENDPLSSELSRPRQACLRRQAICRICAACRTRQSAGRVPGRPKRRAAN